MKHENEIIDGRLIMRFVCGLVAIGGIWLIGSAVFRLIAGTEAEGASLWMPVSACFGTYLAGRYALTGRLGLRSTRGDGD
ncbi:MAG: hypothetical protein GX805_01815 [Gammaproteobacteria bacterium]|nr:hypothetical protein [Gammaproteobacteria bacterium]